MTDSGAAFVEVFGWRSYHESPHSLFGFEFASRKVSGDGRLHDDGDDDREDDDEDDGANVADDDHGRHDCDDDDDNDEDDDCEDVDED